MIKILVVDDEPAAVDMARHKLERAGYEVCSAFDGQKALDIARDQAIDLIISDIMMPGMDGLALCKELKSVPQTARIPVIIATGFGSQENSFRQIGVNRFLFKPFDGDTMLKEIRFALDVPFTDAKHYKFLVHTTEGNVISTIAKEAGILYKMKLEVETADTADLIRSRARETSYNVIVIEPLATKEATVSLIQDIKSSSQSKPVIAVHIEDSQKQNREEYLKAGAACSIDKINKFVLLLVLSEYSA